MCRKLVEVIKEEKEDKKVAEDIKKKREETQSKRRSIVCRLINDRVETGEVEEVE